MTFEMPNFWLAAPEIFVLVAACTILVIDAFLRDDQRDWTYGLVQATLVGAFLLTWLGGAGFDDRATTFSNMYVVDGLSTLLKLAIYAVAFVVFVYARPYLMARDIHKGEFWMLGLFATLGMMIMVSANNLLTLYLGLELLSLASYALVAFWRVSERASEAAMKYFVLGALASGLLLYGMSFLYGMTGSLDLAEIRAALVAADDSMNVPLVFGLVFVVVAIAFKLGAVPFHMWVPDVYDGAPTAVTLFIATAPKIAAFGFLMRLLVEGLEPLHTDWQGMLIVLAVLSLAIGNLIAIAQTSIKRMFAYSTIAHIGFFLLGILTGSELGYAAAMFYVIVYALTAAGGFGMVILLSRKGFEADQIADFKGLAQRNPWFALVMLLFLFSMAGVPPTVGFYAKLAVLQAAVSVELVWLAVYAVIFSIIGAFYYLRVVKVMFFDAPEKGNDTRIEPPATLGALLSANGVAIVLLGIFPGLLLGVTHLAISSSVAG
ncbi:MAG: NADH-quinone oxidoreductase subunit NuoN [Thioalkalivibrionaceae bacterium]